MIECLEISVYDTTLPYIGEIPLDYAQKDSIVLSYEGGDTKLLTFMPSSLQFTLEVNMEEAANGSTDLFYNHLFTGDESKWRVEVKDQNANLLWTGHLLPDDYSEPYEAGTFYLSFTATDGIGFLKGHQLNKWFYRSWQSVPKIIADCLKKTGLSLEIWVDWAIVNSEAQNRWDEIYLNATEWKSDDKKDNCYDILESVLTELGCTLFQQHGRWYIVGINKRGKATHQWWKFDVDGVFIGSSFNQVTEHNLSFYEGLRINMLPPYRGVTVTTGIEKEKEIFPEDLVVQPWVISAVDQEPPPSKYWSGTTIDPFISAQFEDWPAYLGEDVLIEDAFIAIQSIFVNPTFAEQMSAYISLANPPYIRGGNGETIAVKMVLKSFYTGISSSYVFDEFITYDIRLNGNIIASNRSDYAGKDQYMPDFLATPAGDGFYLVEANLDIETISISENGNLDIRVYHLGNISGFTGAEGTKLIITQADITYKDRFSNTHELRRGLNRTNTKEVSIFNGDNLLDNYKRNFIYQNTLTGFYQQVLFTLDDDYVFGNQKLGQVILVTETYYTLINNNIDSVFLKRHQSNYLQWLPELTDNGSDNYFIINLYGEEKLNALDEIWVKDGGTSGNPQTETDIIAREQWFKAENSSGVKRYGRALAEVYHDVYPEPLLSLSGVCKWLVFPNDLARFHFNGALRDFIPVRIEQRPERNETNLTLIEKKNQNVSDYE